ncbi:MAG: metallophosphoesterase [Candidatus Korobacteraceae bacterium]
MRSAWFLGLLVLTSTLLGPASLSGQQAGTRDPEVVRFAVIGDSGTGGRHQREIAQRMVEARTNFPFEFVLMLGDNMYGGEKPRDFQRKFEQPYAALLDAGVKFYASLGNHDEPPAQTSYPLFNMGGKRYYAIEPRPGVRFLAIDSTLMDDTQVRWVEEQLARPGERWTIAFMHHPLYSSGKRHGPSMPLRERLEPLLQRHGVDVVFAGHEHFYERLRPQNGIQYFISGAAGKLRRSGIRKGSETACGFDQDNSFMLVELTSEAMTFSSIARDGHIVDRGVMQLKDLESGNLRPGLDACGGS